MQLKTVNLTQLENKKNKFLYEKQTKVFFVSQLGGELLSNISRLIVAVLQSCDLSTYVRSGDT